ncbi:ABC transporter substrate-binding protein [Nocardioidaceae bacterium SCSIO 66511]|nr:ABC transporter substrate-binding protein [Nocardioidaceae bacterium SCSIO 66511]
MRGRNLTGAIAGAILITLVVAGCGRSDSGGSSEVSDEARSGAKASELVPDDVAKSGVLRVATAEGYPPMEMFKPGTQQLIGVDPDLAAAIATQLDLRLDMVNASFPGLIPGLTADRWDLAMSSMSDTEERRQAVDFVDYFHAGGSIIVAKGNPEGVTDLESLCGRDVVLAKGSSNLAIGEAQNEKCDDKMNISVSEDAPTGLLEIESGRSVASIVDYPVAKDIASSNDAYEVLEEQYEAGPWGVAVAKDDNELRDAVKVALDELQESGKYAEVLEKWNVGASAVDEVTINDES